MRIECPQCSQRFDVTDDFMGKTVECGSCENQFKVSNETQIKEKEKFYPGEKKGAHLERFANSKASLVAQTVGSANVDFEQAHYDEGVTPALVGPVRPRRIIAAAIGVVFMVLVLLVFLFAGGKEGAMRDMETTNRFILVGFTALLGCSLVIYGMARNRFKAVLLSLLLGGSLLAMPVIFPANPISSSSDSSVCIKPKENTKRYTDNKNAKVSKEDYMMEIGYDPVLNAIEHSSKEAVLGIYLRNATPDIRAKIIDFLYEQTGKVDKGTLYPRGDIGSSDLFSLLVLQKMTMGIDEVAMLCRKFGSVNKVDRDLRVIDVDVAASKMHTLNLDIATNPESPEFYRQQLELLTSIDPKVVLNTVRRLQRVEPKALRDDITKALLEILLASNDSKLQIEIITAIQNWSKPGDGADLVVLQVVKKLHKKGVSSKNAMTFLIDRKVDGSEVILMDLWKKNPVEWEDLFLRLGQGAQVLLLPNLKDMDVVHLVSTADILGKVGTSACIPLLEAAMKGKKEVAKKSLKAAIEDIKKR